ncbi:lanthionine synthetase C family protein [Streptomyces sp. NPDC088910]|uniref:lanthionine synthetase C family protein n=1 Tax=Streptomyces sp. NPDC088910 TaxID=3365911 RepID=UPI00382F770A
MTRPRATAMGEAIADLLADPATAPVGPRTFTADRQHLAYGPIGIALLHIERAARGLGPWRHAHDWLAVATSQPLTSGPDSHSFYGAPALAHALASAVEHQPAPYERALAALDAKITTDTLRRLDAAHRRMDAGYLPQMAEFDTIRGLVGYGAYLLRRDPSGSTVRAVLDYCVRLVQPVSLKDEVLPGWWTPSGPSGRPDERFPGGHGNSGLAHGVGGVLSFLALAARRGTFVPGHFDAMRSVLAWLDRWREPADVGIAWPYWVTRAELRDHRLAPSALRRPSWCYGTAGLARARQLAAHALRDDALQAESETTLATALTDPLQLKATSDNGLCHGFAGLAHLAYRVAEDTTGPTRAQLRAAIPALTASICPPGTDPHDAAKAVLEDEETGPGFLNGAAGIALVLLVTTTTPPCSAWDSCLLVA